MKQNCSVVKNLALQYRPDIDGLRAIAVLSVIGFHAFPTYIKSGFVGVDVFFVISGFLISSIIFRGLIYGTFSFVQFYSRRIRRIFPALLIVLVVCYIFGWFSLIDCDYKRLGKHIAAGAAFISNIILWKESDYFDVGNISKPLMHLWSLGVEEQFYLVWPLFLWILWKRKFNVFAVVLFVAIVSFVLNIVFIGKYSSATFYLPHTRFWELLAGSLLAWVMYLPGEWGGGKEEGRLRTWIPLSKKNITTISIIHPIRLILPYVGLILIAISIFCVKEQTFPGYWALLPVFGTVAIISADNKSWVRRILSNRLLVWFGLISYPLYLWHYPILSFTHNILGSYLISPNAHRALRIIAVFFSVVLAWITYELIEYPIRFGSIRRSKIVLSCLLLFMLIMGYLGYFTFKKDGFGFRYVKSPNDYSIRTDFTAKNQPISCNDLVSNMPGISCSTANNPKIAIIGDSHVSSIFYGFLNNDVNGSYRRVLTLSIGGCQPVLGFESYHGCAKKMQMAVNAVKDNQEIKTIILAGYYGYVNKDTAQKSLIGYSNIINALKRTGRKIVFVIDNPTLKQGAEVCQPEPLPIKKFFRKIFKKGRMYNFCQNPTADSYCDQTEYLKVVDKLKTLYPEVVFFDSKLSFRDEKGGGDYLLFKNSLLLYADFNHLSVYGGNLVAGDLIKKLLVVENK
ncbi:MAG: acyltransferase [Coxiellaceae bacterium]|jgi:peptidoglycan/LPS O-acetylase OafA/YrhL|nr:acyltransferase [Coxiellaceae bacterium]